MYISIIIHINTCIRVSDCWLASSEQLFIYIMARTRYIKLCSLYIVLDQRAKLEYYSASSQKQQSMGMHVTPLGHVILIPVFVLSLLCSADSINKNKK